MSATLSRSPVSRSTPATFLFAGGGTGGHITPGLAVAAELSRLDPTSRILFHGSGRDVERRLVETAGFELVTNTFPSSAELRGRPLRSIWRAMSAVWGAGRWLARENVRAVVGLGGYASIPGCLGARSANAPLLLLEQNVIPGRSVEWLSRRADLVCGAFDETLPLLPKGTRYESTGNPVRPEIAALATETTSTRNSLVILGGSQGAESLNTAVLELLTTGALRQWPGPIVHQTGAKDCERVRSAYARAGVPARVEAFLADMVSIYRDARLAISRAGATTLAELACAGCPAILIPYPQATRDHQRVNAEWYAARNAALVVTQTSGDGSLSDLFGRLLNDNAQRDAMSQAIRATARIDAAETVAQQVLALAAR